MFFLTKESLEHIKRHSQREVPKEACGILAGIIEDRIRVTKIIGCSNVDDDPKHAYTIDPKELLLRFDEIEREETLELIGFYHSHPKSSASPSLIDIDRASWDGYIYLIYSLAGEEFRCWRWMEPQKKFVENRFSVL